MEDYILVHWGIPGMRWGVRRYQNTDGTLTELGKQHYGKGGKANSKLDKAIKVSMKKIDKAAATKRGALSYLNRPYQDFNTRMYMLAKYNKSYDKIGTGINTTMDLLKVRGDKEAPKATPIEGNEYTDDRNILKKGTVINSISDKYVDSENYKKQAPVIYAYKDSNEWDNTVYKGPYATYLAKYRGAQFIREHKFQTVKDLLMPTKQQRIDNFKEMLSSKKTLRDLEKVQNYLLDKESRGIAISASKEAKELNIRNIKTDKDVEAAYELFNHAMENTNTYPSAKKYLDKMSKKFDAMSDDNNRDVYNKAVDPIIVFRAAKVLDTYKDVSASDFLTSEQIISNTEKVRKKLGTVAL